MKTFICILFVLLSIGCKDVFDPLEDCKDSLVSAEAEIIGLNIKVERLQFNNSLYRDQDDLNDKLIETIAEKNAEIKKLRVEVLTLRLENEFLTAFVEHFDAACFDI